jgi:AcrR family transcriptional regulator
MSRRVSALVKAQVSDPELVSLRRDQIVRAAVRLFAEQGYYNTTILQIAREAGISTGLVYQYFGDKDDVLLLTLKLVLDTYEQEIPPKLAGVEHPVDRLCTALGAYCEIVDGLREATVLAYRSTKSLRAERRAIIKAAETRTNRIFEDAIRACVEEGCMGPANAHLLAYSQVMYCHAWALKHWAFRGRYTLKRYVAEGLKLVVEPFLTSKGRAALTRFRNRRTD